MAFAVVWFVDEVVEGKGQESIGGGASTWHLTRQGFVRGLGLVYAVVFVSTWVQIHGLIGSRGLVPVGRQMEWFEANLGAGWVLERPTLLWLGSGDGALDLVCGLGVLAGAMMAAGVVPIVAAVMAWALYMSIVNVGGPFMLFQWDGLLLEVGLVAVFLSPAQLWSRWETSAPPSRWMLWALHAVLFRLMFGSGFVKLASGDPTWRSLTALEHHYQTQPLPTWVGWYAHHLPDIVGRASVGAMFAIELAAPLLIFWPRKVRMVGAALMIALQLALVATGNFAFFTVLTLLLCLTLFDDRALEKLLPTHLRPLKIPEAQPARWKVWGLRTVAVLMIALGAVALVGTVGRGKALGVALQEATAPISGWHLAGRYGVFATMTTNRREIVLEGSVDGVVWEPYGFAWKPGDVRRPPSFVAPHQPRLDWQMWFAALQDCRRVYWLHTLMQRLLEREPAVADLLEHDPFEGQPQGPRFIRALAYQYRFAPWDDPSGRWWTRQLEGLYCPVSTLPAAQ